MPVVTYTYTEQEIGSIRELLMQMDAELGYLVSNIDKQQKALEVAGLLSQMQRQLQDKLGIEF